MKACPSCAEEIQDAAIVCKHCGRNLVNASAPVAQEHVTTIKPAVFRTVLVVVGVVVLLFVGASMMNSSAPESAALPPLPHLNINAGRGLAGLEITNRESSPLTRCDVTVRDARLDWVAAGLGRIAPSETLRVQWWQFKSNDQPLPPYIGNNTPSFLVSCFVGNEPERREASVRF